MLRVHDVIAGKVIVQLGWATPDVVRAELREVARDSSPRDLVNRLTDALVLDAKQVEVVRHRVALYSHVWSDAIYVRLLERHRSISKETVAKLISGLERSAFRKRLHDVLLAQKAISKDEGDKLATLLRESMDREEQKITDKYRAEDYAGVAKPLIPNSQLDPEDFKISVLFRSAETRALVDQAELEALRREAARGAEPKAPPKADDAADDAIAEKKRAKAPESAPAVRADHLRNVKQIGPYKIVEVLGVGGMGAVFLGQQEGRGEFCAIKVILAEAATAAALGRFQREIRLLQRITHENVIHLIDSGKTADGLAYLVVPALAGKELRELVDDSPSGIEPRRAVKIFEQVLAGVQAAHDASIVHRDLKPENVFVLAGGRDEVRIMDFGLAKLLKPEAGDSTFEFRTNEGEILGTPAYIAPECILADPVDHRTDIYSLGIILFEMLTGKLPLTSETSQGFLGQHLVCPPATLAEAAPDRRWSPEAESLIVRMLAKSKDERPASCQSILDELKAGLAEKLILGPAPQLPPTRVFEKLESAEKSGWGFRGLLGRLVKRG